jgi:hypothetical protein
MAISLLHDKGTPVDRQHFSWKDLVPKPISKMNVDAFTRVRMILMNGIESESLRFSHQGPWQWNRPDRMKQICMEQAGIG